MATATFHSIKTEKSALILLRVSEFAFTATPVYVPKQACAGLKAGDTIIIPDGFKVVAMTNEDGTPRTAENGAQLMMLQY